MTVQREASVQSERTATHVVKFFSYQPVSVHAMAYSEHHKMMAISLADHSLQLWDFSTPQHPSKLAWLPPRPSASIEGLTWTPVGHLFSCGLDGILVQYDVTTCQVVRQTFITPGPSWCLSHNAKTNQLAVGTEQGIVSVFSLQGPEDVGPDERTLDRQDGRIMCIAWHSSGNYIVTGSPDTLRVWHVKSGLAVRRMNTGRAEYTPNIETTVWSVVIIEPAAENHDADHDDLDMIAVSGDSRGKTCFWSAQSGTLVDAYQSHKADVLTVAYSARHRVVYSSGIDPTVVHFQPTIQSGTEKWIRSVHRYVHTHDVRCVVPFGQHYIASAGADSQLAVNEVRKKTVNKYCLARPPISPSSQGLGGPQIGVGRLISTTERGDNSTVAFDATVLLPYKNSHIDIWRLARPTLGDDNQNQPVKLVRINCRDGDRLVRTCIAPDSTLAAYSTQSKFSIVRLDHGYMSDSTEQMKVFKVDSSCARTAAEIPYHFAFIRNSRSSSLLTLSRPSQSVGRLMLVEFGDSLRESSETTLDKGSHLCGVGHLDSLVTDDGLVIALGNLTDNTISIVRVKDRVAEKPSIRLPAYRQGIRVQCLRLTTPSTLAVVYSDRQVVTYDVVSEGSILDKFVLKCNSSSKQRQLATDKDKGRSQTTQIASPDVGLSTINDRLLFVSNDSSIVVYDPVDSCKRERKESGTAESRSVRSNRMSLTKQISQFANLLCFESVPNQANDSSHQLIAVDVDKHSVTSQLPPAFRRETYGLM